MQVRKPKKKSTSTAEKKYVCVPLGGTICKPLPPDTFIYSSYTALTPARARSSYLRQKSSTAIAAVRAGKVIGEMLPTDRYDHNPAPNFYLTPDPKFAQAIKAEYKNFVTTTGKAPKSFQALYDWSSHLQIQHALERKPSTPALYPMVSRKTQARTTYTFSTPLTNERKKSTDFNPDLPDLKWMIYFDDKSENFVRANFTKGKPVEGWRLKISKQTHYATCYLLESKSTPGKYIAELFDQEHKDDLISNERRQQNPKKLPRIAFAYTKTETEIKEIGAAAHAYRADTGSFPTNLGQLKKETTDENKTMPAPNERAALSDIPETKEVIYFSGGITSEATLFEGLKEGERFIDTFCLMIYNKIVIRESKLIVFNNTIIAEVTKPGLVSTRLANTDSPFAYAYGPRYALTLIREEAYQYKNKHKSFPKTITPIMKIESKLEIPFSSPSAPSEVKSLLSAPPETLLPPTQPAYTPMPLPESAITGLSSEETEFFYDEGLDKELTCDIKPTGDGEDPEDFFNSVLSFDTESAQTETTETSSSQLTGNPYPFFNRNKRKAENPLPNLTEQNKKTI